MKEKCNHEMIYVEDNIIGMKGYCHECGMNFNILHIKQGLYAFEYENNYYLLNTINDMNFQDNSYNITLNNHSVCLYKGHMNKEKENVYVKKLI